MQSTIFKSIFSYLAGEFIKAILLLKHCAVPHRKILLIIEVKI